MLSLCKFLSHPVQPYFTVFFHNHILQYFSSNRAHKNYSPSVIFRKLMKKFYKLFAQSWYYGVTEVVLIKATFPIKILTCIFLRSFPETLTIFMLNPDLTFVEIITITDYDYPRSADNSPS